MPFGGYIYTCLEDLSAFSTTCAQNEGVTRLPFTKEHKAASSYLQKLMEQAGLTVHVDAMGNVVGRYTHDAAAKTLALGSHQDTVMQGGKYDGALGIVLAIVCVGELIKAHQLNYNVVIIAFADEEGVRFHTDYLGSMAFNGHCDASLLQRQDVNGISLAQALQEYGLNPQDVLAMSAAQLDAYIEVHIEQGPVLEAAHLPVGIVTAIQSLFLYEVSLQGMAGHAGTVPMALRKDPVRTACQLIHDFLTQVTLEENIVATVGQMQVLPGAVNVIAEKVVFSLDIRSPQEEKIRELINEFQLQAKTICEAQGILFSLEQKYATPAMPCDAHLQEQWAKALQRLSLPVYHLPSGAGHDAQEMARVCPVGMLFVRCMGGISHNKSESVTAEDMHTAACVVIDFLRHYA